MVGEKVETAEFPKASVTDTPKEEKPEQPKGETEEVDWKARAEAALTKAEAAEAEKGQLQKQLNDTRSQRVNHLKQAERDERQQNTQDDVNALRKSLEAYIRATTQGDTDGLPEKLQQIETETQQTRQTTRFLTRYNALWADLNDIVKDDEGNDILNLYTAPELEQVRSAWNQAQTDRDEAGLQSALTDANKVVLQAERKRHRTALAEAEKTAKVIKREVEAEEQDDDDLGPGAPGGEAITKENIDALRSAGKVPDKMYRTFLRTGEIRRT